MCLCRSGSNEGLRHAAKGYWVYLLHCKKDSATDDLQASSMEKPKGCFQFAEDDISVKTDKHPTSSFQMSNFRIVSLSQQPEKECCCGGVTGKKISWKPCLFTYKIFLPFIFFFKRPNHLLQSRLTFVVDL